MDGSEVVWIACDTCELWYHATCVGLTAQQVAKIESYECKPCKLPKKKRAAPKRAKHQADGDDEPSTKKAKTSNRRNKKQSQQSSELAAIAEVHHEDDEETEAPPAEAHSEATPVSIQQIQEEDFRKITDMWLSGNQMLSQVQQPPSEFAPPYQHQHLHVQPQSAERRSVSPIKPDPQPPSPLRRSASPAKNGMDHPSQPPSVSPINGASATLTSNSYNHHTEGHNSALSNGVSGSACPANGGESLSAEST
ncbi:hypothetical protein SeLEV6574_g01803 [Synchytrium endobioticum]|nr:hypothetical protein SeLEV6574_g01803 [Synchytrium endobioticum]